MCGLAVPIFVWQVTLGDPAPWESLLADDERQRAQQLRRSEDRADYVTCRGVLRALLGRFLGRAPASLRFVYGAHEKPFLEDGACAFNVSRAGGLALIAIAARGRLGIDVERVRHDVDVDALAEEFLTPSDRTTLVAQPEHGRTRAFFQLWVRHEARVKATGRGLIVPALADVTGEQGPGPSVRDLEAGPGYAAALAADGPEDRRLVLHPPAQDVDFWSPAAALDLDGRFGDERWALLTRTTDPVRSRTARVRHLEGEAHVC
jgi:phosphopantetheinyl transferase